VIFNTNWIETRARERARERERVASLTLNYSIVIIREEKNTLLLEILGIQKLN
jgi:hypothetical protein